MQRQINQTGNGQNIYIESVENFNLSNNDKISPYLTFLPIINQDDFVERKEIEELKKILDIENKVILINGIGGVGKTTFAKLFLTSNINNYDHIAWIDITTDIIKSFTLNFQLFGSLSIDFDLLKSLPTDDLQFDFIISKLRQVKGNNLLILDNVTSDIEKSKILNSINLKPFWKVIAISRLELSGFYKFQIDVFNFEKSKELFFKYNSDFINTSDNQLEELFCCIGFHTLTIELIAKTLKYNYTLKSINDVIIFFKSKKLDDQSWQIKLKTNHNDNEATLFFHLMNIFDIANLSKISIEILVQLSVLPPIEIEVSFLQELLEFPIDFVNQFIEALILLSKNGWLDSPKTNVYKIHPLIQQVIKYKVETKIEDYLDLVIN